MCAAGVSPLWLWEQWRLACEHGVALACVGGQCPAVKWLAARWNVVQWLLLPWEGLSTFRDGKIVLYPT
jgi:hypothetical protein